MITLSPGRVLTPGDLYLMTRDGAGRVVVPASITYAIFHVQGGEKSLVSNPVSTPGNPQEGYYYVNLTVPTSWPDGTYQLVWTLQQEAGGPSSTVTEDFSVQGVKPAYSLQAPSVLMASAPATKPEYAEVIMAVRELLSDTNPDRNYHFRPPVAAKTIANFSNRIGFIWDDTTIIRMLKVAISRINTANPMNWLGLNIDNIGQQQNADYMEAAAMGAAAFCLGAEGCRWVADEFSYSLNGVSLDLQKGNSYLALAANYMTAFEGWLTPLTANRPRSMGVRQYRWLR